MVLKFLGSGSGFADEHTSAYFFTEKNEMVIIDCSMLNVQKLKKMDLSCCTRFYVLITHTHGDHASGLGLLLQYLYFTQNKKLTIIAPSDEVKENIRYLLEDIEGCDSEWYQLFSVNETYLPWIGRVIKTSHSPQLEGKCFGYRFVIDNKNIIYSGDTSTLEPFKPYFTQGCEFYVDISVHYGMIHLKLDDVLEELVSYANKGVKIYLMHLDDKNAANEIVNDIPNIEVI